MPRRKDLRLVGSANDSLLTDMSWNFKSAEDLRTAGYRASNFSTCSGPTCGRQIEWWITPAEKKIPLDPGTFLPHWATCADKKNFKSAAKPKDAPPPMYLLFFACRAMECQAEVPVTKIFCDDHWTMLPEPMRAMITQHFDPSLKYGKQSTASDAAINAAIIYLLRHERQQVLPTTNDQEPKTVATKGAA